MFEGFIHPALAAGALLAAVPLLIHLLNRQRHQPLQWAAMRFVLAAYRRTRRRAQLENLLLLLLRMGAVALLAFAVARPFIGKGSVLEPLTESRRDIVLVVDASASTGYRESVESVFEQILGRARELLSNLEGSRGDRVRLVQSGSVGNTLSTHSPEDAIAMLGTLSQPLSQPFDLAATLSQVVRWAEELALGEETSGLEVRLLTDLQRTSFAPDGSRLATTTIDVDPGNVSPDGSGGDAPLVPPIERALDQLQALGVRVVVEDLGPAGTTPPNVGIENVAPIGEVLGPGMTTEIGVRVRNHGAAGKSALRVALEVDGDRLPSQTLDLGARETGTAIFPVTFRNGGYHSLVARLEGDRLPFDDTRTSVVYVPRPTQILMVDGDPSDEIDRDEVGFLRAVLEPPDDGSVGLFMGSPTNPFLPRTVNAAAFDASNPEWAELDLIILANVGSLSPLTIEQLEERVAAGTALWITLGDHVSDAATLESWNTRAWRPDGTGLLPARLRRHVAVPSRRDSFFRSPEFDATHPVLRFFGDARWQPLWTEMPIYEFIRVEPDEDTRVLARLDDEDKSPLLLERAYDRGRVLLWTTSIDDDWTRIPEHPGTLVPFVHELARYAVHGTATSRNLEVGIAFAAEIESFPRNPVVIRPDGTRSEITGEPVEVAEDVWRLPPIANTDRPGLWRIELEGDDDVLFAVHADPAEGDLERIGSQELEAMHPAWHFHQSGDGESDPAGPEVDRGELWRWFAALALGFLIAETLWAAWIGRGRRIA